jgi:hypothetical protein
MAQGVPNKGGWSICVTTGCIGEFVRISCDNVWLSGLYQTVGGIQFV